MIKIIKASQQHLDDMVHIRLEMLKEVNGLPNDYEFDRSFQENCRQYFANGHQTTVLTYDDNTVIGCATLCYTEILPTVSQPTGKTAHLMNVYTKKEFRRQGIAAAMLYLLIEEAKENAVAEITLDTTAHGTGLYKQLGFEKSENCMILNFRHLLQKNIKTLEKYGCHPHGQCTMHI